MSRRPRPMTALTVALAALVLVTAGCGSDDTVTEPRPAAPIEVTVRVGDRAVTVAPGEFGAGLVNLTISNQSREVAELTIEGESLTTAADPIQPAAVGNFKVDLAEGEYEFSAGAESRAKPDTVSVGPERPSAQNELLLP